MIQCILLLCWFFRNAFLFELRVQLIVVIKNVDSLLLLYLKVKKSLFWFWTSYEPVINRGIYMNHIEHKILKVSEACKKIHWLTGVLRVIENCLFNFHYMPLKAGSQVVYFINHKSTLHVILIDLRWGRDGLMSYSWGPLYSRLNLIFIIH